MKMFKRIALMPLLNLDAITKQNELTFENQVRNIQNEITALNNIELSKEERFQPNFTSKFEGILFTVKNKLTNKHVSIHVGKNTAFTVTYIRGEKSRNLDPMSHCDFFKKGLPGIKNFLNKK